ILLPFSSLFPSTASRTSETSTLSLHDALPILTILNDGCLLGSGVSAVLSTTTPEVTISHPNSPYPDTAENATAANTTPFQVSTSSSFVCGTTINFTLTVSFAGGSSVLNFSIVSCQEPPTVVNGSLDTSDPVQEG